MKRQWRFKIFYCSLTYLNGIPLSFRFYTYHWGEVRGRGTRAYKQKAHIFSIRRKMSLVVVSDMNPSILFFFHLLFMRIIHNFLLYLQSSFSCLYTLLQSCFAKVRRDYVLSVRLSVCPSLCPSVCLPRAWTERALKLELRNLLYVMHLMDWSSIEYCVLIHQFREKLWAFGSEKSCEYFATGWL